MQRPSHGLILAATGVAVLLFIWIVTAISPGVVPTASAAQFAQSADLASQSLQQGEPASAPDPGLAAALTVAEQTAPVVEPQAFVPAPAIAELQPASASTVVEPVYVKPEYVNDLDDFVNTIVPTGGRSDQLIGIFVDGILALGINQQPPGDNNWVTEEENKATIFRAAAQHGVIGLLAHNTRAGRDFSAIQPGQRLQLVYGDGSVRNYRLASAKSYQALDPRSPSSDFIDLSTSEHLTAGDVFNRFYTGTFPLVLQTCIEQNGDSFWGRLFLVAEPE